MIKGFAIPRVHGRGAGLGNEMLVWAKAHIAAAMLGLACLPPPFCLNKRGYSRYFRTMPVDWAMHSALRKTLLHLTIAEADYVASGSGDFVTTVEKFAQSHGLEDRPPFYTLSVDGMWGGFFSIAPARVHPRSTFRIQVDLEQHVLTQSNIVTRDFPTNCSEGG